MRRSASPQIDPYLLSYRILLGAPRISNETFWGHLDRLVAESRVIIDVPKGTKNSRLQEGPLFVDYGYLEDTSSMEGDGIDVYVGSNPSRRVDAIICTVDLFKRDSEIKILIGCTEAEKLSVERLYEVYPPMRGLLVRR
jgi:inorganic pyrophosphatase